MQVFQMWQFVCVLPISNQVYWYLCCSFCVFPVLLL